MTDEGRCGGFGESPAAGLPYGEGKSNKAFMQKELLPTFALCMSAFELARVALDAPMGGSGGNPQTTTA